MVEGKTMNGSSNGAETREKGEGQSFGPALNKTASKLFTGTETEPEFLAVSAVAEINKLMTELTSARNYLTAETERIRTETARLKNLSKSALASVDIISENLSKWNAKKEAA
jgi:hypothetical protein